MKFHELFGNENVTFNGKVLAQWVDEEIWQANGQQDETPPDVHHETRNRLPGIPGASGSASGADGIRGRGSGVDVRWESEVGRPLLELAILTTAREHDQPYEWSLHEMEAPSQPPEPSHLSL